MDSVQISKIIAEKIKFNVSTYLSNETLVSIETDYIANGLVAKIEWWALGREMREEVTGYYYLPTSWFQHFKMYLGFKQYKTKSIPIITKHWHVCPHISIPDNRKHIEFLMSEPLPFEGNFEPK